MKKDLTYSENKTKKTLYLVIGRKISESRKSSRKKIEGISKKLNISTEILKRIESGEIENINYEVPINGFIRAFAKATNADISEELEKLQSDYFVEGIPKKNFQQTSDIKTSKILMVFIVSFCFLLLILYLLSMTEEKVELTTLDKEKNVEEIFFNSDSYDNQENEEYKIYPDEIEKQKIKKKQKLFFEIIFLEDTWIEIYSDEKSLIKSGLYKIGDSLNFEFQNKESDFFIKSGNLGGFQIFFKDEFFAPFGYSGEVNRGFFLKEKISKLKKMRL